MVQVTLAGLDKAMTDLMAGFGDVTGGKMLPHLEVALKASVEMMAEEWRAYLTKNKDFPGSGLLKRPMNRMANRVQSGIDGDGLGGKVTVNAPWSEWMEKGAKAFDMKNTHPYGKKSRVSKDGTPYLIIPIRHGTPGTERNPMPKEIYSAVRSAIKAGEFTKSQVVNSQDHTEKNYGGQNVWRASYKWGSRLTGLSQEFQNLEGLVWFNKKSSGGGYLNSSYMTFRIISAKSPEGAWIMPEKPAIIPHVIESTKDTVAELLQAAIRKDLGI